VPAKLKINSDDIAAWKSQYIDHTMTIAEIARQSGVAKNSVRKYLIRAGVTFDKGLRLSRKAKGRPSRRRGAKLTPEQMTRHRRAHIGNKYSLGRTLSEASRQKMSATLRRKRQEKIDAGLIDPKAAKIREAQRYKLKAMLRSVLRAAKTKKRASTAEALGYDREELVTHIGDLFLEGMNWSNPGSFHIDHIVPIAVFLRRGITDPKIISSLANLRPLYPADNHRKSCKYDGDFDADLRRIVLFNERRYPA
jgi:hypothetical protein